MGAWEHEMMSVGRRLFGWSLDDAHRSLFASFEFGVEKHKLS